MGVEHVTNGGLTLDNLKLSGPEFNLIFDLK
jgi:hypothetical protein